MADEKIFSIFVVLAILSIINVIAVATVHDSGCGINTDQNRGQMIWAYVCSCVSTAVCLIYLIILKVSPDIDNTIGAFVAIFLCLWWTAGAGVETFSFPFVATSNGYFSAWGCFGLSWYLGTLKVPMIAQSMGSVSNAAYVSVE